MILGGLNKLLARGEIVEEVTGGKGLLGKLMEGAGHVVKESAKNVVKQTLIGGLGADPKQLAQNVKDLAHSITHPIQALNRRYDFLNLSTKDYVRVPMLSTQEFRVDPINT